MRTILMGLALFLLSLPVAAGEPCNAGSVDCCALEGTATGDIDLEAFKLTFDDGTTYLTNTGPGLDTYVSGVNVLYSSAAQNYSLVPLNMAGNRLYDSTRGLHFGDPADCTPTHDASGDTAACGDFEVVGATYAAAITATGTVQGLSLVSGGIIRTSAAGVHGWAGRSEMYAATDGRIHFTDDAATGFSRLTLGPEANTHPAFYPDGAAGMTIAGGAAVTDPLELWLTDNLHIGSSKGALTNIKTKTESVTFANDAAKTTAGDIIPDGAMIMGVSGRVTTLLTGCTATSIGDGVDIDLFKGGLALVVGSTFTNADATASYSTMNQGNMPSIGAAEITVSAIGGNCTAGVIALTVHYIDVTAATAN